MFKGFFLFFIMKLYLVVLIKIASSTQFNEYTQHTIIV